LAAAERLLSGFKTHRAAVDGFLPPSTTRIDRGRKRELYAKYGVKHLWYADPKRREVEMLTLDRASYRVTQIASNGPGVFAPFSHEIDIAQLWKA
jgi:hypothetical protein